MECPICGREVKRLVKAEIEGAIVEVCEDCAKKYGRIVSVPPIKRKKSIRPRETEEELDIVENYGELVKEKRMKLGLSQEELAKKINEKKSLISKIEREEIIPDKKLLKKLEKFLNIKLLSVQETHVKKVKRLEKKLTIGDIIQVR